MERIDLERFKKIKPYSPDLNSYNIRLDANESFIEPEGPLKDRLTDLALNFDYNRYPDPEARELCRSFGRAFDIDPRKITVGNGSDELISIIIATLLKSGQRLLVCDPDFSMYRFYAERAAVDCVAYEKSADFELDTEHLVQRARETEADMVIFSNPCNPTGRGVERIDIIRMTKALSDRVVVIDEAYMDFWNQSVIGMAGELPNLIVLKTCSKALGLAALRVGFAVCSRELADIFKKCKSPYNVTSFGQAAARLALDTPGYIEACTERILASRAKLCSGLKLLQKDHPALIEVLESRTNFVVVLSEKREEIHKKLKQRGISIRLTEGLLRITAGSDEQNGLFLAAMGEILKELEALA